MFYVTICTLQKNNSIKGAWCVHLHALRCDNSLNIDNISL